MREILFRGKEIESRDWVYGWFEMYAFGYWPLKPSIIPSNDAKNGHYDHVQVDIETIGQYTGLNDKNGVKIFEGDILEVRYGNEIQYCAVKYDERTAQFVFDYGRRGVSKVEDLLSGVIFAVIGNIHDNPELLKKS